MISADQSGNLPLKVIVPITKWQDQFEGYLWLVKLEPDGQNGLDKLSAADAFQIKSLSVKRSVRQRGVLSEQQVGDIVAAVGLVIQIL